MKNYYSFKSARSFNDMAKTLSDGIISAYENAPKELQTFEEIAEWAGQHCILTEMSEEKRTE